MVDSHVIFEKHFKKRKTFYRKQKFKIIEATMEQYEKDEWETIYDPFIEKKFSKGKKINKKVKPKKSKYDEPMLSGVCLIGDD